MHIKHPLYQRMLDLGISLQDVADVVGCHKTTVHKQLIGIYKLRDDVRKAIELMVHERLYPNIVPFSIPKQEGAGECTGRIQTGPNGIEIYIDGFGMATMAPGHGSIIYLEHYEGVLRLVVHGDIRREEPTSIIDLSLAEEHLRLGEE